MLCSVSVLLAWHSWVLISAFSYILHYWWLDFTSMYLGMLLGLLFDEHSPLFVPRVVSKKLTTLMLASMLILSLCFINSWTSSFLMFAFTARRLCMNLSFLPNLSFTRCSRKEPTSSQDWTPSNRSWVDFFRQCWFDWVKKRLFDCVMISLSVLDMLVRNEASPELCSVDVL